MTLSTLTPRPAVSSLAHGKQYVFTYTTTTGLTTPAYELMGTVPVAGLPYLLNTLAVTTANLLFKFQFTRDGTNWDTSIEDYPVSAAATAHLSATRNAQMYRVYVKPAGAANGSVTWTLTLCDTIMVPEYRAAFAYESITVSNAHAESVTIATMADATRANITVEDNPIRVRWDGTAPTTSEGHYMQAGDSMVLDFTADIYHFKAIATGGDAKIRITYSR